eukprot:TRINITY_DN7877_c0_g1_i1.p1 TRINITY_DN7877_c0_g1~~TRINITY_DN7877_c0_g1_i1.p1  ORF type:complete len:211 (+),score=60.93 TRINITY_DN7877_c0_g1_i1:88-633(+)
MDKASRLLQRSKHAIARAYCLLYLIGVYEDEDKADAEAFQLLTTECDTSDPHVQYLLGWCYVFGYGCAVDEAQAVECYERAGNHFGALYHLAEMLWKRSRSAADRQRAIALYRHSATQGDVYSQFCLAKCYEDGIPDVLEKDIAQAKHWYSFAAEQGDDWYSLAAEHGDDKAAEALQRLSS